jgi:hypothetical protein
MHGAGLPDRPGLPACSAAARRRRHSVQDAAAREGARAWWAGLRAQVPGARPAHLAAAAGRRLAPLLLLLVLVAHAHAPHDLRGADLAVPLYRLLPVHAAALLQPRQARVIRAPDDHGRGHVRAQRVAGGSGAIGVGPVRRLPGPVALDLGRRDPALVLLLLRRARGAHSAHDGRCCSARGRCRAGCRAGGRSGARGGALAG